jgi:hypothetical protein
MRYCKDQLNLARYTSGEGGGLGSFSVDQLGKEMSSFPRNNKNARSSSQRAWYEAASESESQNDMKLQPTVKANQKPRTSQEKNRDLFPQSPEGRQVQGVCSSPTFV